MVKGISRRVIVIKSPDRRLFDEAIFIVREDALQGPGVTGDEIIKEAQKVADSFVRTNLQRGFPKIPAPVYAALGAVGAAGVWLLAGLIF